MEFGKSIVVPSQGWIVVGRLGSTMKKAQQLTSLDADWKEGPDFISKEDAYKTSDCIFQVTTLNILIFVEKKITKKFELDILV